MKVVAVVQARMSSVRLPGKVLKEICNKPIIQWIVQRTRAAKTVDEVVIITSTNPQDDPIAEFAEKQNILCYRGSEHDVVDRCYNSAKQFNADIFVRITADNPFTDPQLIDEMVLHFQKSGLDLLENSNPCTFPHGLNFEVLSFDCLEKLWKETRDQNYLDKFKNHVIENPDRFKVGNYEYSENLSKIRLTVDYPKDLELARKLFVKLLEKKTLFLIQDVIDLLNSDSELMQETTTS